MWDTQRINKLIHHAMIMKTNAVNHSLKHGTAAKRRATFKAVGHCPFCDSGKWQATLRPNIRAHLGYAIHLRCDNPDCDTSLME